MENTFDGPFIWHLTSVDDIDELRSELLFANAKLVVTPDGGVWEVWVDTEDDTLQMHRLRGQNGCTQIEAESISHAFSLLQGGAVVYTIESED